MQFEIQHSLQHGISIKKKSKYINISPPLKKFKNKKKEKKEKKSLRYCIDV